MNKKENNNKIRKIFLDELPRTKNNKINWNKTIGCVVHFIYDDIEGDLVIINYINRGNKVEVLYNDKKYTTDIYAIKKCSLSKIINNNNDFKFNIGDIVNTNNNGKILITEKYKENGYKKYKYTCIICGNEDYIREGNLLMKRGCNICNGNKVVKEINSIWKTNPELVRYFVNEEDSWKYSKGCTTKIRMICPDCGNEKEMSVNTLFTHGFSCLYCGDNISYPEKLMLNVLQQLGVDFKTQLSKSTFKWCDKYRYDFYFRYNNEDILIETHGRQHYEYVGKNSKFDRTLEEETENDRLKKELAIKNGIKKENYIVIDCRKSELNWIRDNKNGILNSRLVELFDLNIIDWNKCGEFALSNLVKVACEYKRNNPDMTTTEIGQLMSYCYQTIIKWLKQGSDLNWCVYNAEKEKIKASNKVGKNGKRVEMFKNDISLDIFDSASELERKSEELFGTKLSSSAISRVCNGKKPQYKGYTFKYI